MVTGILPSAAMGGANHTGAHGELAPARVSSQALICSGEKWTLPAPRYTNQERCNPRFLPTVTRVGGSNAGFSRAAGGAPAPRAPPGAAPPLAGAPPDPAGAAGVPAACPPVSAAPAAARRRAAI